jgi:hypothetical protein
MSLTMVAEIKGQSIPYGGTWGHPKVRLLWRGGGHKAQGQDGVGYGMHGCIIGGWCRTDRDMRRPQGIDIGSAFRTQEQMLDLDL